MEDAVHAFTGALTEGVWEETPLQLCSRFLCALRGCPEGSYLEVVGGNGGQCTHVWPSGEFAFRCNTCGVTPSSAVCLHCFRAGDHEGHDYRMYISDAGGCCDCGDPTSWRDEGCCPRHRSESGGGGVLPAGEAVVLPPLLACMVLRLQLELEFLVRSPEERPTSGDTVGVERALQSAGLLLSSLIEAARVPMLRGLVCGALLLRVPGAMGTPPAGWPTAEGAWATGAPEAACTAAANLLAAAADQESLLARDLPAFGAGDASGRPQPGCEARGTVLYWLLSLAAQLPESLAEPAATLLILSLYCRDFRCAFGASFLPFYESLVGRAAPSGSPVAEMLDRLTVQLLNTEASGDC